MPRRRRREPPVVKKKEVPFHSPFQDLARRVSTATPVVSGPGARLKKPAARLRTVDDPSKAGIAGETSSLRVEEDESEAFLSAVAGARRLEADLRVDAPAPALGLTRAPVSEDMEALAALSDLVSGDGHFDISDSTEYVEGAVVGLDPRILRRLRRGEFPYQDFLDLHGMTAAAARESVERFVSAAQAKGDRCVLIIHGRGRNSRDQVPVLKERLKGWLARGRIRRLILAFTSSQPADGGTGALYVLLRRRRGAKEPIAVYEGAKRE